MSTDISLEGRWKIWVSGRHLSTKAVRRGPSMSRRLALMALAKPSVTEPPNYTKLSKKIHLPGQRI
jgi:hypothetical protein